MLCNGAAALNLSRASLRTQHAGRPTEIGTERTQYSHHVIARILIEGFVLYCDGGILESHRDFLQREPLAIASARINNLVKEVLPAAVVDSGGLEKLVAGEVKSLCESVGAWQVPDQLGVKLKPEHRGHGGNNQGCYCSHQKQSHEPLP